MSCEILDKPHTTRATVTRMATTATARIVSKSCQMVICHRVLVNRSLASLRSHTGAFF